MRPNQNQQNTTGQENSQQNTMAAPEAASKRDVEEAEQKAQEAKAKATEEAQRVEQALREEIEELRMEKKELREALVRVDQLVNKVYELGATKDGEAPFNPEMSHMMPENEPDADQVPVPFGGDDDG